MTVISVSHFHRDDNKLLMATLGSPGLRDLRPAIHTIEKNDPLADHYTIRICKDTSGSCLVDACELSHFDESHGLFYIQEGYHLLRGSIQRMEQFSMSCQGFSIITFHTEFNKETSGDLLARLMHSSRELRSVGCIYISPYIRDWILANNILNGLSEKTDLEVMNLALHEAGGTGLIHEPFLAWEEARPDRKSQLPDESFNAAQLSHFSFHKDIDMLAVTTCPRPDNTSYLIGTINRLDKAGAKDVRQKFIFHDGLITGEVLDQIPPSWNIRAWESGPSGTKKALWRVFHHFREHKKSPLSRLLLMEDDVVPCRNAVVRMLMTPVPEGMACMTFFDIREVETGKPAGIYRRKLKRKAMQTLWGLQAVLFDGEAVNFLAGRDPEEIEYLRTAIHQSDVAMAELLAQFSRWQHFGVHIPNLFQHCGDVSSWGNGKKLRATNFAGEEFNALLMGELKQIET